MNGHFQFPIKIRLILWLFMGCGISNILAQTDIPAGNVSGIWDFARSPFNVNGDITILNGETLTIQPGVTVSFTGLYKLSIQGRLLAIGTAAEPILFTASDRQTGWHGLRFKKTPSTNDTSKLIYSTLQFGNATRSGDLIGGAVFIDGFSKLIISHSLVTHNRTSGDLYSGGGGIGMNASSPIIEECVISHNTANGGHGGGLYISGNSSPVVRNNAVFKNRATGGGGIVVSQGSPVFINNTIVYNTADSPGGAVCHGGAVCIVSSAAHFFNTILYGNAASIGSQVHLQAGAQPSFHCCAIEGGREAFGRDLLNGGTTSGTYASNIEIDPLFSGKESDDYHLSETSPCVGAGGDSTRFVSRWIPAPPFDCEGNPRPNPAGSRPDIGAFENPSGHSATSVDGSPDPIPWRMELCQNYPNPFNPSTVIGYHVNASGRVNLSVYDILGRKIAVLVDAVVPAGTHEVEFMANHLAGGIYFYRMETGSTAWTRKMLLVQ